MSLAPGTRLGPSEVLGSLGAGGMGEVYRARDPRLARDVAVKVISGSAARDPDRIRRLQQEAQATAALNHQNILAVYDVGTADGLTYIVSELLEGTTLRHLLDEGRLHTRDALKYTMHIAEGLAAAHDKGIAHRDLKPENVFITDGGVAKILDFGLAKQAAGEPSTTATTQVSTTPAPDTQPGTVLGTVGYMAPEQVRGGTVDHRADLFAFGAVLYEMLGGRRAFQGDSKVETMNAILKEEPPAFPESTAIPRSLDRIVRRCLAKRPQDRFQSAIDLAFALDTEPSPSVTRAGERRADVPVAMGRQVGVLVVIAIAVLALVAGAAINRLVAPRSSPAAAATFKRLTFEHGTLRAARFADNGNIVYSAASGEQPLKVFLTRDDGGATSLNAPPGQLLSVSAGGELAVSAGHTFDGWLGTGTLSRMPLLGGGARAIADEVRDADWLPDGAALLIVRRTQGRDRLEWPMGTVVYRQLDLSAVLGSRATGSASPSPTTRCSGTTTATLRSSTPQVRSRASQTTCAAFAASRGRRMAARSGLRPRRRSRTACGRSMP